MRLSALALLLCAAGCVRTNYNLATDSQEYTLTSTDREVETGRKLALRVERELTPVADEAVQQRVRGIGERIAAVCDRQELVYHFTVVSDEKVNAFSLPGGFIYLHEGLVKEAANDDELAAVIAHEVAHVTARHSVKRFESALGMQLAQIASIATGQAQAVYGTGVVAHAAQLSYARQDEIEADRLGVKYMKAAGFNPQGMLDFLAKLQEINREEPQYLPRGVVRPHYAMTHPYVPERTRAVKEAIYGVADYIDYLNTPD